MLARQEGREGGREGRREGWSMKVSRRGLRVRIRHGAQEWEGGREGGKEDCFTLGSLPVCYHAAYRYVCRLVEGMRALTPQVTLFLLEEEGRKQGGGGVLAKCMLMANGPLPDFKVRWADGAVLTYKLRTGALALTLGESVPLALPPFLPRKHEWNVEGGGSCWVLQGGREGGREGGRVRAYLSQAQGAMRRCLEIGERWEKGREGGKKGKGRRIMYESVAAAAEEAVAEARRWRERFSLSLCGREGREGGRKGGKAEEKRVTMNGISSRSRNDAGAARKDKTDRESNSDNVGIHAPSSLLKARPILNAHSSGTGATTSSGNNTTTTSSTSSTTTTTTSSSSSSSDNASTKDEDGHNSALIKHLPGVGQAIRTREGAVEVRFVEDGSLLTMSADGTSVRYCREGEGGREGQSFALLPSQRGERMKGKMPREVREKLRVVLTRFLA